MKLFKLIFIPLATIPSFFVSCNQVPEEDKTKTEIKDVAKDLEADRQRLGKE